ncbi:MAG: hypothetical protein COC08_03970 [Maribacter sp.]|nr:MAG: hypothetical protein COC08_03970 [Maribacter sp.]
MKKISIVLVLAIIPFFGFSQSIFDKYEDMDNVASVVINKSMITLVGNLAAMNGDDQEAQDFKDIAHSLKGIKVFITEDKGVSADMAVTVKKYLKSSSLEELMRIKDKGTNVKFYIKSGKDEDHVSELLMFVSGINNNDIGIHGRKFESVLVSLTGDIDLNKIGSLTEKMNLPKALNKVGKRH